MKSSETTKSLKDKKSSKGSTKSPKKKKAKVEQQPQMPEKPEETEHQKMVREEKEKKERLDRQDRAATALTRMRRNDLVKECVLRGLSPELAVNYDNLKLSSWFMEHLDDGQDLNRLQEYDEYVDKELDKRGAKKGESLRHPIFKLGLGNMDDMDDKDTRKTVNTTKVRPEKVDAEGKPKEKRVKDESLGGIYSGTKKAATFECAKKGIPLEETYNLVRAKFPEANEKSMKIWYNKALKELK